MSEFVTIALTSEIPVGEGRRFEFEDRAIGIFNVDGRFTAIDDVCPHLGASLCEGDLDPQSGTVVCPWHGWRFDVFDGAWADNPRIATDVFELRVIGDQLQVRIPDTKDEHPDSPDS